MLNHVWGAAGSGHTQRLSLATARRNIGDSDRLQVGIFVDPDTGTAYATGNPLHPKPQQFVMELTPDYLNSTGRATYWEPRDGFLEGWGMFKRGSVYYYLTGHGDWVFACAASADGATAAMTAASATDRTHGDVAWPGLVVTWHGQGWL